MTDWRARGVEVVQGPFHLGPVDLDLSEGETVAVIGRSGAGKTTLLRALCGLAPLHAGRVERGGVDVTRWRPERRGLGYVPQGLGLFPHRSVRRNVRFAAQLRRNGDAAERTEELLDRFGLSGFADRYPAQLSTGEQQRTAVARALAADPELLLWDEPLGALDVGAREELLSALREVRERESIPLVVVTHDPSVAYSLADRFLVLDRGSVQYQGAPARIVEHPPDDFLARFLGYENVFRRQDLAGSSTPSFSQWLAQRSGPGGVCFGAQSATVAPIGSPGWELHIRRVEPTPSGLRLDGTVDGLALRVFRASDSDTGSAPLRAGDRAVLTVPESALRPLGGGP